MTPLDEFDTPDTPFQHLPALRTFKVRRALLEDVFVNAHAIELGPDGSIVFKIYVIDPIDGLVVQRTPRGFKDWYDFEEVYVPTPKAHVLTPKVPSDEHVVCIN